MFGRKKEKKEKEIKTGSFRSVAELTKSVFRKRDIKFDKSKITKEDKKAAILAVLIFIGLILLLWFLPFTHQFIEDVLCLRI